MLPFSPMPPPNVDEPTYVDHTGRTPVPHPQSAPNPDFRCTWWRPAEPGGSAADRQSHHYADGVPTLERFDVAALRKTITTFRDAVRAHAERLNRLNVYPVPDGDTGTNMARTLDAVVAELDSADTDSTLTVEAIAHGSLMGARGNSGVILSQIMRGMVSTLKDGLGEKAGVTATQVADALQAASTAAYKAVLKPVEGTILTVVRKSADAARDAAGRGGSLADVIRAARDAGRSALKHTPDQLPALKDAGVVDAGGAGYLLLLDSALNVVDGEPVPDVASSFQAPAGGGSEHVPAADHDHLHGLTAGGDTAVGDLRYEVMYFLELPDEQIDAFKSSWGSIGDSIVVVGGDGIWNCHVHTNDIGAAIESALDVSGRPSQIRVTDLFEEVADEHARREATITGGGTAVATVLGRKPDSRSAAGLPPVECAVVAVASGDGLVELFGQLGVQGVVVGGQTMNPSTAELLDLVEHVNADEVVILPNNKNIIGVAQQVDALTSKTVHVVPTTSMPEALSALIVYDPEADAATNATEMGEAATGVLTGEITQAVRPTKSDVGDIAEGDWIGIVRGDGIAVRGGDLTEAALAMLEHLLSDEHEIVTIICGDGATADTTAALRGWLSDRHADLDVEVHNGGQPLYPYLIGVE
jgi:DAK2 domain fusion protein YloV